ncbi:MAG: hypothetical protein Q9187_004605 [Circinaria calcarea]
MPSAAETLQEDRSQVLGSTCVYGPGNSACADYGRTGSTSHQSQPPFQTSKDNHKDPHRNLANSDGAFGTKLTSQSLVQHNREQARLHAAAPVGAKPMRKQLSGVMAAAQSLDIDLSKEIFEETLQDHEGEEPMKRYLSENNHRVHAKPSSGGFVGVYRTG